MNINIKIVRVNTTNEDPLNSIKSARDMYGLVEVLQVVQYNTISFSCP